LETKKIGVVGSGKMAREHLRALSAHPHTHIAAICSTNMISAIELSKEFDINRFYPSLDVMEFQNVDALVVAISIDSIDDLYPKLLRLNIPLLLEKPFGMTLHSACQLQEIAASRCSGAFVALNRRNYSNIRRAHSQLSRVREARIIEVRDQQWTMDPVAMGVSELGQENWPLVNSIHSFDLGMSFARGDVTNITRSGNFNSKDRSLFSVTAEIIFDSGDTLYFRSLWNGPGPWSVAINVNSERWTFQPLENGTIENGTSTLTIARDSHELELKAGLYHQCDELVRHLNGLPNNLVPIETAMRSIETLGSVFNLNSFPNGIL